MDVSVVIPTRNRSALLAMAVRSVLRQQGVTLEVIVIDEASTDDTPVLLQRLGDTRVRVVRHDVPQGLSAARNHGAAEARGEWLGFLDDDDLWAPDKLARQVGAAREAGRDWAYAGAVNIEGGRIVNSRPPLPPEHVTGALPRYNAIPGGGSNVVMRRATWERVGPFETRFRSGGEDWEMSIRLAKHGPPAWVCSPLVARRLHAWNMSLAIDEAVRATRLIETLHGTRADWGRLHRWLAHSSLRSGRRRTALRHFAIAAMRGQVNGVASDIGAILGRRFGLRTRRPEQEPAAVSDTWTTAAAAWLRELDGSFQ